MSGWLWTLVAILVVLVLGAIVGRVLLSKRRERTKLLQERFGREYDRTVDEAESRRAAEEELEARLERRRKYSLPGLTERDRARYEEQWRQVERQFDESPLPAVGAADALTTSLLADCGYPMESFDQRAGDLSVDHPDAVEHYRRAHETYLRADAGKASSEDLYEALQHYRALLDDLLSTDGRDDAAGESQEDASPPTRARNSRAGRNQ